MNNPYCYTGNDPDDDNHPVPKPNLSWMDGYQLLVSYKQTKGHVRPKKDECFDGYNLGRWCSNQRHAFSCQKRGVANKRAPLDKDRIQMLNDLGFEWQAPRESGRKRKTINGSDDEDDKKLSDGDGKRTETRRTKFRHVKNRKEHVPWETMYQLLVEYKTENEGAFPGWKTVYRDKQLGQWVSNQRRAFSRMKRDIKSKGIKLSQERWQKLNDIGFVWNAKGANKGEGHETDTNNTTNIPMAQIDAGWIPWDESFALLQKFQERHGHANPKHDATVDGRTIGRWCMAQRAAYQRQKRGVKSDARITDDQIERLESIGFEFKNND